MKYSGLAILAAAMAAGAGAQEPVIVLPVDPLPAPAASTATIVMFRPASVVGFSVACPIRYKGKELVELGRGKFAEWRVPAGSYILANKTSSVEVNVTAGQTKHVRCSIKPGFMSGRADLQIVDQETFARNQAEFERKEVEPAA